MASGANTAGIKDYNKRQKAEIEIRQCKSLNNIVERDHRNIKRRIRLMLGLKSFWTARIVLAGIELVQMLKKRSAQNAQEGRLNELRQSILLTRLMIAKNQLRKSARPKFKSLNATEPSKTLSNLSAARWKRKLATRGLTEERSNHRRVLFPITTQLGMALTEWHYRSETTRELTVL